MKTLIAIISLSTMAMGKEDITFRLGGEVKRIETRDNGELHVYYKDTIIWYYTDTMATPAPRQWKCIYGVKDGKIVWLRRVDAKVTPAQPEKVEWPEDSK